MSNDMSDWLSELTPRSEDEDRTENEPTDSLDLMADLRNQMDVTEEAPPPRESRPPTRSRNIDLGLLPWQQFFLSMLLFLDVAIVGLLFLVMLGRMVIPAL